MDNKSKIISPVIVEMDSQNELINIKIIGRIDFYDAIQLIEDLINNPDFEHHFRIFVDLREMDYYPTYDELLGVSSKLKNVKELLKNKIAILTQKGPIFSVIELIAVISSLTGMKMMAFKDIDIAEAWLFSYD